MGPDGSLNLRLVANIFLIADIDNIFIIPERSPCSNVCYHHHCRGVLDRLRTRHHHQTPGKVPEREDHERKRTHDEREDRRQVHGPRCVRNGRHPWRIGQSQVNICRMHSRLEKTYVAWSFK